MKLYIKKVFVTFLISLIAFYSQVTILTFAEEIPSRSALIQSITNTGDNGEATSSSNNNTNTQVNNKNEAVLNQNVQAEANTGYNEASRNISIGGNAGMITTGDAVVNAYLQADLNKNTTGITGSNTKIDTQGSIFNTGDGTNTNTTANSTLNTYVTSKNTTYINQGVNSKANTGHNIADRNISIGGASGVITTGNAIANTDYLVTANGSVALVGGNSNGNGPGSGASIVLLNAGENARFGTYSQNYSDQALNNDNQAVINQLCASCFADTGHNVASRNINRHGNAGVIQTQNAVVNVDLLAAANSNQSYLYGGASPGSNSQDIFNTGDTANSNSNSNNTSNTAVNNNNQAAVNQSIQASANTGYNVANRNISIGGDAGVINTGNAIINAILGAVLNSNSTQTY